MIKVKKSAVVFLCLLFVFAAGMGAALGWTLSETQNIKNSEYFTEFNIRKE